MTAAATPRLEDGALVLTPDEMHRLGALLDEHRGFGLFSPPAVRFAFVDLLGQDVVDDLQQLMLGAPDRCVRVVVQLPRFRPPPL